MTTRVPYDEFGLFHENAEEFGLAYARPPLVRRTAVDIASARRISALIWGEQEPELLLVHGGGQNAHTWDTVALALGRPLVAVDLPGHGHSDDTASPGRVSPEDNARDLAVFAQALKLRPKVVVGMSLGGLTSIALTSVAPEFVAKLVLVDVTPGVNSVKAKAIADFINGPATFPSFDELLARTIEHNPGRTVSSLRRGILHNAMQLDDGSWMWRYRRFPNGGLGGGVGGEAANRAMDYSTLWDALSSSTTPVLLARGMRPQSVVDDADVAELRRRRPDAQVVEFAEAGHSLQGDTPVELAQTIEDFAGLS